MKLQKLTQTRREELTEAHGVEFTVLEGSVKQIVVPVGDTEIHVLIDSYSMAICEPEVSEKWTVAWKDVHGEDVDCSKEFGSEAEMKEWLQLNEEVAKDCKVSCSVKRG